MGIINNFPFSDIPDIPSVILRYLTSLFSRLARREQNQQMATRRLRRYLDQKTKHEPQKPKGSFRAKLKNEVSAIMEAKKKVRKGRFKTLMPAKCLHTNIDDYEQTRANVKKFSTD